MQLQILQEDLSRALSTAQRFTSAKAQLPVLANILLSAEKNKLYVVATNLETSISVILGAKIEKEGKITVPGRIITEIISNLTPGTVELRVDKEQLHISSGNFRSSLLGMNPADFPVIPNVIPKGVSVSLPTTNFLSALSKVMFASSIDETRPVLTGVLVILDKESLVLVATDGFRLSKKSLRVDNLKLTQKLIIPRMVLTEMPRVASVSPNIHFSYRDSENQVLFGGEDFVLASRVIEGEFPDFERIIPKTSDIKLSLDKEDFLRAIKLSGVFARDTSNIVKLLVEKDKVTSAGESQQFGNQSTVLEAKVETSLKLDNFQIAFNYKFLEEALLVLESDEVKIGLTSPSSPAIFYDSKDPDFLHLIMPVRLQE